MGHRFYDQSNTSSPPTPEPGAQLPGRFHAHCCELHADQALHRARFRCRTRFQREPLDLVPVPYGILLDEEGFVVRAVLLDHDIPCLGFALEEKLHMNVWKNRLQELGLPTGRGSKSSSAWCASMHRTTHDPDSLARSQRRTRTRGIRRTITREVLRIVPGQKIAYVVDVVFHAENARRIVELVRNADILFMEPCFSLRTQNARPRAFT